MNEEKKLLCILWEHPNWDSSLWLAQHVTPMDMLAPDDDPEELRPMEAKMMTQADYDLLPEWEG